MINKDIFLLMGQSNMAGRGLQSEVEPIADSNISVLEEGAWRVAEEPLHHDSSEAGVGLAMSFAQHWRSYHPESHVSLIPCAVGSTNIDEWLEGPLYDQALNCAKLSKSNGTLRGVLWHQGESNSGTLEKAEGYADKLAFLINKLRRDLEIPNLAFIAGELPQFLKQPNRFQYADRVNLALASLVGKVPGYQLASSEGLTANADNVHFNAQSLRELGARYFQAYLGAKDD
ncbi:sialate O-acetylesterase [Vibrio sp. S4M6]|uniref:sialate O-acetylesterase n=1 Tax=Vibrio sinus TaxID=2946865 RepID=UPI00202A38B7|nr:sialate O-acetylesterase [Vibrio sinus]MCL9782710.1 sialate O-acetylesterase [Vibrio sinus]